MTLKIRGIRIDFSILSFVLLLLFLSGFVPTTMKAETDAKRILVSMLFVNGEFNCTTWSKDGKHWVTAEHCVNDSDIIHIGVDDDVKNAKVIKSYPKYDMAVLESENPRAKVFYTDGKEPVCAGFPRAEWSIRRLSVLFLVRNNLFGFPVIRWLENSDCLVVYFRNKPFGGASGSPVVTPKGMAILVGGRNNVSYAVLLGNDVLRD